MRAHLAGAATGLCLALLGCRAAPPAPPNIVLIVVDTLRADRLGVHGNADRLTPFLDELAARAVVYHRAYAQSSWTSASIATLWTSRYQSQHGVTSFTSRLADGEQTLAELLQAAGYATGLFSANVVLAPHVGFAQGFDKSWAEMLRGGSTTAADWVPHRAETVNGQALAWLDGLPPDRRARSFVHLQYMETHPPYLPSPAVLAERFAGREIDLRELNSSALMAAFAPPSAATVQTLEDLYDAEVVSIDRAIRALFADLGKRGLLDNALVIITSDHGDQFMEHGRLGHRQSLYNEEIHVPLLVLLPGRTERIDVAEPVGLIDVAPTILAWAGAAPAATFEGRVLPGAAPATPRAAAETAAPPVFSELLPGNAAPAGATHERAALRGTEKLILHVDGGSEFYDLARDPDEQRRDDARTAGLDLRTEMQDFRRLMTRAAPADTRPLDAQTAERLRALGYAP